MSAYFLVAWIFLGITLGGCGLLVPETQDFGDRDAQIGLVQGIVHNINCELRDSFFLLYEKNGNSTFMDSWGVEVLLSLDTTEKSTLAPSSTLTPTPLSYLTFTLAGGVSGSSQAELTDKLHSYYTVKQILKAGPCDAKARQGGPMLMQSDLKLDEWLFDSVAVQLTRQADFNNKALTTDVLYHEVQFQVDTSAQITPGFKLKIVTYNNNGTFLSVSRNRTHDLQITLGPVQDPAAAKTKGGTPAPAQAANNVALAGEIGRAVADAVKSALSP